MNAAIVAIGDELLTGQTQDINTSYIARALAGYGITVVSVSFVADEMAAITDALASAAARSSLIITTGGIGPTSDDITRHGVAEFSGKELELRQVCLDKLVAYLKEKGRELTETNKRQAYIPKEAEVVPNDRGTADGFITTTKFKEEPKKILTLPGVPREMRALLDKALPELCSSFSTASNKRFEVVLKVFGLPESDIGQEIERLGLDKDIIVAYRPHFPVVTVELFSASSEKLLAAKEKVIEFVAMYNQVIRDINILTRNQPDIIEEITYFSDAEREAAFERLGSFQGNSTLNTIKQRLQNIIITPVETQAGRDMALLSQAGVSTNASGGGASVNIGRLRGYLEINERELDQALEQNFLAVRDLFGKDSDSDLLIDSGVAYSTENLVRPFTQTGGILAINTQTLDSQITRTNTEITNYQDYLEDYEQRMRLQFGQMESAINSLESQSRELEGLNPSNGGNN